MNEDMMTESERTSTLTDPTLGATTGRGKGVFYVHTLGCQMNVHDSERIAGVLEDDGYIPATEEQAADKDVDLIIMNTCAVRENAAERMYGTIGLWADLKRTHPNMQIAIGGCMAQLDRKRIAQKAPWVDAVFGTKNIGSLPRLLDQARMAGTCQVEVADKLDYFPSQLPVARASKVSSWVSISIGCNNTCTFCIVPTTRGKEHDRRPGDILAEIRRCVDEGAKEVTLLGQNVNSYGKDLGIDVDFADLLRRLNAVPGDFWLRFMTSHPKDASPKLFSAMAECDKVAKQLHLPFQSGSDEILHRMNRRYTAEHYKSLIADARSKMPDITLSSDIIVGFPGETDEDFEQTLKLVQDTRFDLLFTFLYSPRTGTPAASYEDNATPQDKQRRFERLLKAQDEIVAEKQAAYQGKKLRLLVDGNAKGPEYPFTARTEGNLLVCVRGDDIKIGEFIEAEIEKTSLRCLFAHKL